MRLSTKNKATMDDVRKVALTALVSALDDRKEEAKRKPGLTGVRAVATGAVIYTAGKAAYNGRRFIRERFGSDGAEDEPRAEEDEDFEDEEEDEPRAEEDEDFEDDEEEDEPRAEEDEDFDEPRAEEDEDFEDEEEDEPRAEEDEDFEDEEPDEDEEPEAEEDEDFEDEDYEDEDDEDETPSRRPPSHAKRDPEDVPEVDLPSRPSRSRSPVST